MPQNYLRILFLLGLGSFTYLRAQSLVMVSGNGQVVQSQFLSNAPLVVEATNGSGNPASGVAITWQITSGAGTLEQVVKTTGANGQASAFFLATDVPGNESFFASTVTATSASGSVSFVITTTPIRTANGGTAAPPAVQLLTPKQSNLKISGQSGSTLPAAVVVQVNAQAGPDSGQPVPNVGIRIVDNQNPTTATPEAVCNGTDGVVLTNKSGVATCNLTITAQPGTYQIAALVGEYQYTPPFALTVTPGAACSFKLSSNSQNFAAAGGTGTVNVSTTSSCTWTASSNAPFITITSGASGTGSGSVGYSVAANTGAARNGTMSIAAQTFTVTENAGTPGSVAINTPPNLAPGNVGSTYSVVLSATGGTPPYTWSFTGSLPPGLTLNAAQGIIAGTPTTAGTYNFTLTAKDSVGTSASQNFSITINSASTSGLTITNTSFPSGSVGQSYQQLLTTSGACVSPFDPSPAFTLTGGALPNGLTIVTNSDLTRSLTGTPTASGSFTFTLTATDACSNTATASFSITISGAGAAQMTVNPTSVSFTIQAGASNIPANQTISVGSSTTAVYNYTATVATQSGGNWLTILNGASGSTPGTITVGLANFSSLAPGPYSGTITVGSQAANSPIVVTVSLTVLASPVLTINPQSFTVTQVGSSGQTTTRQLITISSSPQTTFTAVAATQTGGTWLSVSPSQGSTPGSVVATIDAGGLAVGAYTGTVTITAMGGAPQAVTVTLDVVAPAAIVASPAPVSLMYTKGGQASQTLSLSSTGEVLDLTIGVSTKSGGDWLEVQPKTATTPANVTVSVNPNSLATGVYHGTVNISASDSSVAPLSVPVTLNVNNAEPVIGAVTNAASFAPGPIAPGEFVTIFGTSLGPSTPVSLELAANGNVATILGGTEVTFDNIPAPMVYTSALQVSAIVPYEVGGQSSVKVKVEYQGVVSAIETVRVIDAVPAIFVANASGQGAILNEDLSPNSTANGAAPGSVISIFATGAGATAPYGKDGVLAATTPPFPKPVLPVKVQINGEDAEVMYAGAAPGQVAGMLQVNARVPMDATPGTSLPITISVGPATSQAGVTVAIHP